MNEGLQVVVVGVVVTATRITRWTTITQEISRFQPPRLRAPIQATDGLQLHPRFFGGEKTT